MKKILIFTAVLTILAACSDNDVDTNSSTADTTNQPEIKTPKKGSPEYYQNMSEDNLWDLADKGDSLAQYTLGTIYYRGGDYMDAYKLFMSAVGKQDTGDSSTKGIKNQNADAQAMIGMLHYSNHAPIEQDFAIAKEWLLLAAQQNNILAMNILGEMYEKGFHNEDFVYTPDYLEAIKWYSLAAEQDSIFALGKLAYIYTYVDAIEADPERVVQYHQQMADLGDAFAQTIIGRHHLEGNMLRKNYQKALGYFELAAEQNYIDAFSYLGAMYSEGKGVGVDYTKAKNYYKKGCELGAPFQCKSYEKYENMGY